MKLEKALEVMGDSQGLAVECLRSELEKAKMASRRRPINVEVDECRKFIARSEKRHRFGRGTDPRDGVTGTGERAL